ncbi:MAG: hypothetical protein M1561_05690 [Gammaproteobacteria bacterium]|nr:hypothetical protein [Gammaproteobacteria bacterium]
MLPQNLIAINQKTQNALDLKLMQAVRNSFRIDEDDGSSENIPYVITYDIDKTLLVRCTHYNPNQQSDHIREPTIEEQKKYDLDLERYPIDANGRTYWLAKKRICGLIKQAYQFGVRLVIMTTGMVEPNDILGRLQNEAELEELQWKLVEMCGTPEEVLGRFRDDTSNKFITFVNRTNDYVRRYILENGNADCSKVFLEGYDLLHPQPANSQPTPSSKEEKSAKTILMLDRKSADYPDALNAYSFFNSSNTPLQIHLSNVDEAVALLQDKQNGAAFREIVLNGSTAGYVSCNNKKILMCILLEMLGWRITSQNAARLCLIDDTLYHDNPPLYSINEQKFCQIGDFKIPEITADCNYHQAIKFIQADVVTSGQTPDDETKYSEGTYFDKAFKHLRGLFLSERNSERDFDFYHAIMLLPKIRDTLLDSIPAECIEVLAFEKVVIRQKMYDMLAKLKRNYYARTAHRRLSISNSSAPLSTSSNGSGIALAISSEVKREAPVAIDFNAACENFSAACKSEIDLLVGLEQSARKLISPRKINRVDARLRRVSSAQRFRNDNLITPIDAKLSHLIAQVKHEMLESIAQSFAKENKEETKQIAEGIQENFLKLCSIFFNDALCECINKLVAQVDSLNTRWWGDDPIAAIVLKKYLLEIIGKMTTFATSFLTSGVVSRSPNDPATKLLEKIKSSSENKLLKDHRRMTVFYDIMGVFCCCSDFPTYTVQLLQQLSQVCDQNMKALKNALIRNAQPAVPQARLPNSSVSNSLYELKHTPSSSVAIEMQSCAPLSSAAMYHQSHKSGKFYTRETDIKEEDENVVTESGSRQPIVAFRST